MRNFFPAVCKARLCGTAGLLGLFCAIVLASCPDNSAVEPAGRHGFPAEFEKQDAVWLCWPVADDVREEQAVRSVIMNIIKAVEGSVRVDLLVQNEEETRESKRALASRDIPLKNIAYHVVPDNGIWLRDVGPFFITDGRGKLKVVDFRPREGAGSGSTEKRGRIDRRIAQEMKLPVVRSELASGGGALEFNGKGVMMTTESVLLRANAGLSKKEIENEYRKVLGIKKIIWLRQGLPEDDFGTCGHVDEFARFASPDTVLLAAMPRSERDANEITRITYERMEENFRLLQRETDQDGRPFKIIRMPVPRPVYDTMGQIGDENRRSGSVTVRSYLNFLVTNKVVVMPKYWKRGQPASIKRKDAEAKNILQKIFNYREVVAIEVEALNRRGGGIHCATQQQPLPVY